MAVDTQTQIIGAWRLMTGRPDGLRYLDLSADGFWNSFFAIVVAVPALAVSWLAVIDDLAVDPADGSRLAILLKLATADLGAWVLPLVAFALVARPVGLSDRFVPYVVATNWGSVIVVWMMMPVALLRVLAPGTESAASILSFVLFAVSIALTWRLTNAAVARGPAIATGVFVALFIASLIALFSLQSLLGLPDRVPA